ncbi:MAG: ABC transporter substrate-binding protein, partial [Acetobacteraceae bacterium]|nr:ABC transporter substrate-binding protein [Acetobacteraceae bacterium]
CVQRFRARVTEAALLETDALDAIDRSVAEEVERSVRDAKEAPRPTEADLLTDVYVAY